MSEADDFDRGWDAPRRRQVLAGLKLTPLQRLQWLEDTLAGIRRWHELRRAAELKHGK